MRNSKDETRQSEAMSAKLGTRNSELDNSKIESLAASLEPRSLVHCLTFDIEEHFQVSAFDSPMRRRQWEHFESRVERNTYKILELLSTHGVRGTFFILAWVAERHPRLVRDIAEAGNEVGSHGYAHELVVSQTPSSFREDVKKAKSILEHLIGKKVLGYRAPSFSVSSETSWVLPILVEEGHAYDSSIFPIIHDRYGWPGANPWCHEIKTPSGAIWEIPPSTVALAGTRLGIRAGLLDGRCRSDPVPQPRIPNRSLASSIPGDDRLGVVAAAVCLTRLQHSRGDGENPRRDAGLDSDWRNRNRARRCGSGHDAVRRGR